MDDPIKDILDAINLCAASPSPDVQVASILHYFTPSASFIYPIVRVVSSPSSRRRIIRIYLLYRAIIPQTAFEINYTAFDEHDKGRRGHLFVHLVQIPHLRGVSWLGWRPRVEMHVEFDLVKEKRDGEERAMWRIEKQEDIVQPTTVLLAIPPLRFIVEAFYFLSEVIGLFNGWLLLSLGIWRPVKYLHET